MNAFTIPAKLILKVVPRRDIIMQENRKSRKTWNKSSEILNPLQKKPYAYLRATAGSWEKTLDSCCCNPGLGYIFSKLQRPL